MIKSMSFHRPALALLAVIAISLPLRAQTSRFDSLANAPFQENRPTNETSEMLRDELLFQRATQTYL